MSGRLTRDWKVQPTAIHQFLTERFHKEEMIRRRWNDQYGARFYNKPVVEERPTVQERTYDQKVPPTKIEQHIKTIRDYENYKTVDPIRSHWPRKSYMEVKERPSSYLTSKVWTRVPDRNASFSNVPQFKAIPRKDPTYLGTVNANADSFYAKRFSNNNFVRGPSSNYRNMWKRDDCNPWPIRVAS